MLTEAQFQQQVEELATLRGWVFLHIYRARTKDGWHTAAGGTLGKGWVDLLLMRSHGDERRVIYAELKRIGATPTPDQEKVLTFLRRFTGQWDWHWDSALSTRVDVYVWDERDWDQVQEALK